MALTVEIIAKPGGGLALPYDALAVAYASNTPVEWVFELPAKQAASLVADGKAVASSSLEIARHVSQGKIELSDKIEALVGLSAVRTFDGAIAFLAKLEQHLTLRTFVVGHGLSIADFLLWGALKGNSIASAQAKRFAHVSRWAEFVAADDVAQRAVADLATQSKVKKPVEKKAKEAGNKTFELGLPNAVMGAVVTRLPPEPSGYLHIGHAKAAILNQYFARMYKGSFRIRFDDTNPSKEKAEFEESIIEDLKLLGIKGDATSYTSDFFDKLFDLCVQLIKSGDAYADDTAQEVMRAQRMDGVPSARRDTTPEESLARFEEMKTGSAEGARWCIRAKMSVDDPNKALRDPVIYRVNVLTHHRTGDKWKIYPTYDFACPVVDSLEGVTHALRTNEYRARNPQYEWFIAKLALRPVTIWDFGRINLVYTLLSKRKLKWFVENGYVDGWDDPRFPTVRGVRRRGMTIEALTEYMLQQGPSQAITNLEWDSIWSINKKVIDPIAPRHVALLSEGVVTATVAGASAETKDVPRHKKNADLGNKKTVYAPSIYIEQADAASFEKNEEVTLMDWGNAFVRDITKSGDTVTALALELHLEGDFKKTKKKVTWLAADATVPVTLLDFDYLITKKKLEDDDEVEDYITPVTKFTDVAVADANTLALKKGDIIQFERKGFYILDKPGSATSAAEFIFVPDGKATSVALKYKGDPKTKAGRK